MSNAVWITAIIVVGFVMLVWIAATHSEDPSPQAMRALCERRAIDNRQFEDLRFCKEMYDPQ